MVDIPQIDFTSFFEEGRYDLESTIPPLTKTEGDQQQQQQHIQHTTKDLVVEHVRKACETQGFFYVTGHDAATLTARSRALTQIRRLFDDDDLSHLKARCSSRHSALYRGYTQSGGGNNCAADATDPESKESFTIGAEGDGRSPMHGPNLWPRANTASDADTAEAQLDLEGGHAAPQQRREETFCNAFREDTTDYFEKMLALARHIAHVLALSLGLPGDFFTGRMKDPVAQMVSFKYPPEDGDVSCGEHTDCGFLTLLVQTAPGLEVYSNTTQEWLTVELVHDAVLVNLGDLVQYWTRGRYRSTPHRVHNTNKFDRYSIVFFANCDFDAPLDALDDRDDRTNENDDDDGDTTTVTTATTAGEYVLKKLGLMYLMGEGAPSS